MRLCSLILLIFISAGRSSGQQYATEYFEFEPIEHESHRGLHVVNHKAIWISGTHGSFALSKDKGEIWRAGKIDNEELDLRDIHGFDSKKALVITSGSPGRIYLTKNAGSSWDKVYDNNEEGIFLDGMDFWDEKNGVVFGDPIEGKLKVLITADGGTNWLDISEKMPPCLVGEAGYAASGTALQCIGKKTIVIGTGGASKARFFRSNDRGDTWNVYETPLLSEEGKGIFSTYFWNESEGVVVGGSYVDSTENSLNCARTVDGGKSWKLIVNYSPNGYRSCVTGDEEGTYLICCGRNGIDVSTDKGESWQNVLREGYYSCAAYDKTVYLSGRKGKFAIIELTE